MSYLHDIIKIIVFCIFIFDQLVIIYSLGKLENSQIELNGQNRQ